MAKRPSYEKFTITSIPDSASGGGFNIPDYEKDIRAIVNQAVKSALSEGEFFKTSSRVVDKATGETRVDVYVHPESANVVADSLNTEMEKFKYKGGTGYKYSVSNSPSSKAETEAIAQYETGGKEPEYQRRRSGAILKLIGLVTSVVDITRRILSSVLSFSTQTVKDMTTAHNYGMSYEAIRSYRHVETKHGLKEGTITDAIADIQNKFGNITSLDEKALEALAVVMGGKIEEMATMGLGSSNPEAILGSILDAFNEKANAGYNSVGQYVGEQQARRELYSYLLKISPQVADIFATMQEEQHNINSIFRDKFENYDEWKNLEPTKRGGNELVDYNVTVTVGQEWNQVKDVLSQIKEKFAVDFAPAILDLLRDIKNTRIGMTVTENMAVNEKNKKLNTAEIANVKKTLESIPDNTTNKSEYYYKKALEKYLRELEKANEGNRFGNINNAVRTPDEIRVMANALAESEKGTPSMSMQYNLDKLTGTKEVSIEDILKLLEGYNKFDLDKEKGKYKKELDKANDKIYNTNKKIAMKVESEVNQEIADIESGKRAKELAQKAVYEDKTSMYYIPEGFKRGNTVTTTRNELLAELEALGIELEGKTLEEKKKYALDKGYLKYGQMGAKKYLTIDRDVAKNPVLSVNDKIAMKKNAHLNSTGKQEAISYSDDDFIYWLYNNNKHWFDEHLGDLEVERIKAEAERGNRLSSLFLFNNEADKWVSKLPDIAEGMGELYSYNETGHGGETTHKIILEFGIGDNKQQIEVGNFLGEESYEGYLGKFVFSKNNDGTVDYSVSLADTASEERYKHFKGEQ